MSGSGGGGYSGGGSPAQDCQTLSINTHLSSPDPVVIAKLKIGDILEIVLTPPRGPVQAITAGGEVAGAILNMDIDSLIQCISDGHDFQAKVLDVKGGNCQVLIKHK